MTTATGDIAVDFSGLTDVNPYTNGDFTYLTSGQGQIVSGSLRAASSANAAFYRYTASTPGATDIVSAKFEVGFTQSDSNAGHGVILYDASQNGFLFFVASGAAYLSERTGGSTSGPSFSPTVGTFSVGTVFELEYQKSTGRIEVFKDGVSQYSSTASTHSDKDLSAGIFLQKTSTPNFGIVSFAGDGYTVTGPTITGVDTDNSVYPGQSFDITGTNFGATQGTGGVTVNGVAYTVNTWSDTVINVTAVRGGNNYGTHTLTVTTDAATTATISITQEAEPGTFAVTAASPNTTDDASLWTGLIDTATSNPITIVDGDQAWVKNPNNLTNLAIQPDGTITADDEGDFVVQIWLLSEGVWGADQTVTFAVPDDVAPVFSAAPAVAATSTTGHTISATIDEGGTLYGVRLADGATAPSSAQVKAGQDAAGAAAPEAKSVAATASTSADLVFSTASSDTPYDYYVVAEDDASTPNIQASPTLIEATTSIEPPPASVPGSGRRGFLRPAVRGTVNSIIGSIIS